MVYGALEIKASRSGRDAPLKGNDIGKCLIAYQCLHKAFRTYKGRCQFAFPKNRSAINKQLVTAEKITGLILATPDEQLGGLRVEARATCPEFGCQGTPEDMALRCERRLKVFTVLMMYSVLNFMEKPVQAYKAEIPRAWHEFQSFPDNRPEFKARRLAWFKFLATCGHM